MSTDKDMYAEREEVFIIKDNKSTSIHYDSIAVGAYYFVKLFSGTYSVYRKSNLFDDDLIEKVKTESDALQLLNKLLT